MEEIFDDILWEINDVIQANKLTLLSLENCVKETNEGLVMTVENISFSPGMVVIPDFILTGTGVFNTEINNEEVSVSRVKIKAESFYKPHFHSDATEIAIVLNGVLKEKTTKKMVYPGGMLLTKAGLVHGYEAISDAEYLVVYIKQKKIND